MTGWRVLRAFAAGVVAAQFSFTVLAQTPLACDASGNSIIDNTDINLIVAAHGQNASGTGDARDANADGVINALDSSLCTMRCTRAACSTLNLAPRADAGPDQRLIRNALVLLDGAGSSDADSGNGPLRYQWSFVSKPAGSLAVLSGAQGVNARFTADLNGLYRLNLSVTDPQGLMSSDTVEVSSSNVAPRANAGTDATHSVGTQVVLDGSASSDANGDGLTFSWTLTGKPTNSAAVLVDANTPNPRFTADLPGTYRASLVVNDGSASSLADEVVVSTANTPPAAHAGPDQTLPVTRTVVLDGSASSDVDENGLTYLWNPNPLIKPVGSTARLNNPNLAKPSFVADLVGTYVFQLMVHDGLTSSQADTVEITSTNLAPIANAGGDLAAAVNALVQLDGSASSDPDGNALTYSWVFTHKPAGAAVSLANPSGANTSFTATLGGTYIAQLRVNDGFVDNADTVTIQVNGANVKPVARAGADRTVVTGAVVFLNGSGSSDADSGPQALGFSWSLSKPLGSNAVLNNATTATPSFTVDVPGNYQAQLTVDDGEQSSAPDTVNISTVNSKPVAHAGADQVGIPVSALVNLNGSSSTDADGHALSFSWSLIQNPGNVVLNAANTATPSFTPSAIGTYTAQLLVSDGFETSAPADTVNVVVGAPTPVAQSDAYNATEDVTLNIAAPGVLGNDQANGAGTLSAELVTPPATGTLSLNANGSFSYTPAANANGAVNFAYRAKAGTTQSAPAQVSINIGAVNDAPTLDAIADRAVVSDAGQQSIGLAGISAGPASEAGQQITINATSSNTSVIPNPTLQYTSPNSTGVLNFTPAGTTGSAVITITAMDNGGLANGGVNSVQRQFTVTVGAAQSGLPTVTLAIPDGTANELGLTTGSFSLTRTGGSNALPLTVRVSLAGTALRGTDYLSIGSSVGGGQFDFVIPADRTQLVVFISPLGDNLVEGSETVVAGLIAQPTYNRSTQTAGTVTISDSPPVVTVTASDGTATEAGLTTGAFTIARSGGRISHALTVRLNVSGTAASGADYSALGTSAGGGNFDFVIPADQTELVVTVTPLQDTDVEGTETVVAALVTGLGTYIAGAQTSGQVSIADDDSATTSMSLALVNATSVNVGQTAQLRVTLSQPAGTGGVVVSVVSGSTGVLTVAAPGTVSIAGGQTQGTINITGVSSGQSIVTATATGINNATLNVTASALPGMTVNSANSTIGSGLIATNFTVALGAAAPTGGVQLTLTSANANALRLSTNTATTGVGSLILTVPAGATSVSYNIQGMEGITTTTPVQITASAPGYTNASATMNIVRAGIRLLSVPANTTSQSNNTNFSVEIGSTSNSGSTFLSAQAIRPGGTAVGVTLNLINNAPSDGAGSVAEIDAAGSNANGSAAGSQNLLVTLPVGASQAGAQFDPFEAGTVQVQAISTIVAVANTATATAATTTVAAAGVSGITLGGAGSSVGSGLVSAAFTGTLSTPAPTGGVQVLLTSAAPAAMRLSASAATAGASSVTINVPAGATTFSYFLHGVEGISATTPVEVNASAPGLGSSTAIMNVVRSGIRLQYVPAVTTTYTTNAIIAIQVGTTTSNGATFDTAQTIRPGGAAIPVTLSMINNVPADGSGNVGELEPAGSNINGSGAGAQTLAVSIPVGASQTGAQVDMLQAGTVQVRAVAGVTSVSNTSGATSSMSVAAPRLKVNFAGLNVGSGLINRSFSVQLEAAAPPGGVQVTLSSSNPSVLRLSTSGSPTGVGQLVINVAAGVNFINYDIQGMEGITATTAATVTASGAGYQTGSASFNVTRASVRLTGIPSYTPRTANNTAMKVEVGTTVSGAFGLAQSVRPGGVPIGVTVALSNSSVPNVAEIDPAGSVLTGGAVGAQSLLVSIPVGSSSVAPQFDPLNAGAVTISTSPSSAAIGNLTTPTRVTVSP